MLFLEHFASRRHCRSCTRTHLRTTTSWSWCQETLSSCPRWSRAARARVGCLVLHSARGYQACCRKIMSPAPMSRTRGSFTGEEGMWQDVTLPECIFSRLRYSSLWLCMLFSSCLTFKYFSAVFCNWSLNVVVVSTPGPTPSSTVPPHPTPVASLVACYLMESSMRVCSIAWWTLPPTLACVLPCR